MASHRLVSSAVRIIIVKQHTSGITNERDKEADCQAG